jgi:hypothetical protein
MRLYTMKRNGLLAILLVPALLNVATAQQEQYLFTDTTKFVQLPSTTGNSVAFSGGKPAMLSVTELKQLDMLLRQAVTKHNQLTGSADFRIRRLNKFYFQLATVINGKGEKEVWINAGCHFADDRWRKNLQEVQDGGNCYFRVRINFTGKKAGELQVNGYA